MAKTKPSIMDTINQFKSNYRTSTGKDNLKSSQFLIDKTPYKFTPSFIEHNGKVMSILKMYVRPGSNANMTFQDIIDFIPIAAIDGVETHLISKDMIMKGQEKQKLVKKNANQSKGAIADTKKHNKKKKQDDKSTELMQEAQVQDYNDYELILDSQEPLVIYKWLLLVIGNSQDDVEEQIEIINTLLDQNHDGARWDSLPAEQMSEYRSLFRRLSPNIYDHTSTASNYSGLNFALSAGLQDDGGLPLGRDALSISGSTAYFDFDLSTKKQAFIAAPRNSRIPLYTHKDELRTPSMSSIAAQAAANQIMFAGNKAHHIVLNDFDYFEKNRYYAPAETDRIFKKIDVSKQSINPLEGFGDYEHLTHIYDRLIRKIVNIFNIMLDFKMDIKQQASVITAVDQFYRNQRLWNANADKDPYSTRIINIPDPDEYPTMTLLLNEFTNMAVAAQQAHRENKADDLEALYSLLRQALSTYRAILGRPTKIVDTDAPQVYYDFSSIDSLAMKQIQLLNIIDFIIHKASSGDVIVIHGFDKILSEVSKYLAETISAAQNQGIRFIFTFDAIQSPKDRLGKMNDMFEMQQLYYVDLDTDVDWCFIGRVLPTELALVKKALNQELGPTNEQYLQLKRPDQVLVHRRLGNINNFVQLAPII